MLTLTLSQATEGFILAKEVQGCSPHTIRNYQLVLRRLRDHLTPADPLLNDITPDALRAFIRQLQTTHYPQPGAVTRLVTPPNPKPPEINPYTHDQVRALLAAVGHSAPWKTCPGARHTRPAELRLRDRATLLFFLDTGVRVSELVNLSIADLHLRSGDVLVRGKSRLNSGAGATRTVYLGRVTRKALWQYLTARGEKDNTRPLFATLDGRKQDRRHLYRHLQRLGHRAGVNRVGPHRFRHTFAINFLRQTPNIYALQRILGHSDLNMVKRYLAIAQADCQAAHRLASPVDNWNL